MNFPGHPEITKTPKFVENLGGVEKPGRGSQAFPENTPPRAESTPLYAYTGTQKGYPPFLSKNLPGGGGLLDIKTGFFSLFGGVLEWFFGFLCFGWILLICLRWGVTVSSTSVHKPFAIVVGINSAFCYSLHLQLDPKWVAIVFISI